MSNAIITIDVFEHGDSACVDVFHKDENGHHMNVTTIWCVKPESVEIKKNDDRMTITFATNTQRYRFNAHEIERTVRTKYTLDGGVE